MLTLIIGGIGAIVLIATIGNGEWLSAGIAAAILIFLMLASAGEREGHEAYVNCRRYWAEGGPDRKERR